MSSAASTRHWQLNRARRRAPRGRHVRRLCRRGDRRLPRHPGGREGRTTPLPARGLPSRSERRGSRGGVVYRGPSASSSRGSRRRFTCGLREHDHDRISFRHRPRVREFAAQRPGCRELASRLRRRLADRVFELTDPKRDDHPAPAAELSLPPATPKTAAPQNGRSAPGGLFRIGSPAG